MRSYDREPNVAGIMAIADGDFQDSFTGKLRAYSEWVDAAMLSATDGRGFIDADRVINGARRSR
jgi:hypothetical protein